MGKLPNCLEDAVNALEEMLGPEDIKFIDGLYDSEGMCVYHSSMGMHIRNEWGLWTNTITSNYFKSLGFTHADDISEFILESLWNKRHSIKNDEAWITSMVEYYKKYWDEKDKAYDEMGV